MKKCILALSLLFCGFILNAQVSYDAATNKFTLSTIPAGRLSNPPLIELPPGTNPGSITPPPGYAAFVFEYGDGYFTTNIESVYQYTQTGNMTTVLSLSGRYDTIRPPRVFSKMFPISGSTALPSQSLLSNGEFVRLTPIARSINVRDEMLFILTYKIPPGKVGNTIKLFYNNGAVVFNPIITVSDKISESTDPNNNSNVVSRVRNHFGETLSILNSPATIPGLTGTGYQNALSWSLPAGLNADKEYNIFVTLRTGENLPTADAINIEAAFLYNQANDGPVGNIKINGADSAIWVFSSLTLPESVYPHDPNYISVLPKCIVKGVDTEKVKYRIHFQNEGGGAAHRLKIKVHLDSRLAAAINKLDVNSFIVTAGKKLATHLTYKKINDSTLRLDIVFPKIGSAGDADSSLSCNHVPLYMVNELTMGDVYFNLYVPKSKEADLAAQAEITFYNSGNIDMEPVFTKPDTLFIRNTCNGTLYPLISAIEKKYECQKCKQSCSCSWLGLCWCWWLLIVTGVLLLTFLISRRKRIKANNYNP